MVYLYIFLSSLCSFSYEFLIANIYANIFKELTFFSISIMVYLLSIGFGTKISESNKISLIKIEISLITLATLSPFLIQIGRILNLTYTELPINLLIFSLLNIFFGLFTGLEFARILKEFKQKFSISLFWNYFASLISSILIQVILINFISSEKMFMFFGMLNLFFLLLIVKKQQIIKYSLLTVFLFLPLFFIDTLHQKIAILKSGGDFLKYTRIESKYQVIEKFNYKNSFKVLLNDDLQFDSKNEKQYHDNLVNKPINYHVSKINKVLLLGAGDGLALRELNKYNFDITHIELDKAFQKFSKEDSDISTLNLGSLDKITTVFTDAFNFVKYDINTYDLIIIDFPYPTNYELSRLYSLEFYQNIAKRINLDGLVVLDAPINSYKDGMRKIDVMKIKKNNSLIFNTIKEAGFKNIKFYDTGNEGFVLAYNGSIKHEVEQLNQKKYPIDKSVDINTVFKIQKFEFEKNYN